MKRRSNCPACGAPGALATIDLPFDRAPIADYLRDFYAAYPGCDFTALTNERFQLADCPECHCVFQVCLPEDQFLTDFYGQLSRQTTSESTHIEPYRFEQAIRELAMVVRFLQPGVSRPRVLDFGTGRGAWAVLSHAAGLDTAATDLSDHAADSLRRQGVTWFAPESLPPEQFDFVNTEQVCEHLTDPAAVIRHLSDALRPGGVLKIGVPHDPGLRKKLHAPNWTVQKSSPVSLNSVAPLEHLNHFAAQSLVALAARAGLRPLHIRGWTLVRPLEFSAHLGLRQRIGLWLRTMLRETYRPFHTRTQTMFFEKPGRNLSESRPGVLGILTT